MLGSYSFLVVFATVVVPRVRAGRTVAADEDVLVGASRLLHVGDVEAACGVNGDIGAGFLQGTGCDSELTADLGAIAVVALAANVPVGGAVLVRPDGNATACRIACRGDIELVECGRGVDVRDAAVDGRRDAILEFDHLKPR